jgi:hypothetical protein
MEVQVGLRLAGDDVAQEMMVFVGERHGDERRGGYREQIPFSGEPVIVAAAEAEGRVQPEQRYSRRWHVDEVAEEAHLSDVLVQKGVLREAYREPEQHNHALGQQEYPHAPLGYPRMERAHPEDEQEQVRGVYDERPRAVVGKEAEAQLAVERDEREQRESRKDREQLFSVLFHGAPPVRAYGRAVRPGI